MLFSTYFIAFFFVSQTLKMRVFLAVAVLAAVALSAEAGMKMRKNNLPESLRYE